MKTSPVPRRYKLLALLACVAVWLALAASVVDVALGLPRLAGASASRASPEPPRTIPDTDVNPYGANFFLEWEPETWKIEKTLQMAHDAGVGWVKQQFPWEDIQLSPGKDGFWDDRLNKSTWEKYDRIVDLARKYNLEVIARLDRPPKWARQDNHLPQAPPDRFEDYGDFVYAVVSHYKGKIRYYQIWNEPNVYPEWGDHPPDPEAYVRLLKIAHTRAREADPDVWILSAPLAQTLEESDRNVSDLTYLERMYEAGAKDYFDILFANAYGFAFPPSDPPSPDRLNFSRVLLLRQMMERHGDGQKAVWFNEFGWNASPEDFPPEKLPWARVSEQLQASYTVQAIQQARAEWPWAGVFNIWYFRQAGNLPADRPEYYFRMVDPGFTPRPIYQAVKKATADIGTAGPGTHEETNPAAVFSGAWRIERQKLASGGAMCTSRQAGDSATITFQGKEIALLAQTGPSSGMLYVTLDGREANRLPRDRQGRSYLDLGAQGSTGIEWIPVADGLHGERHVLRMVVAPGQSPEAKSSVAIDAFRVADTGPAAYEPRLQLAGLLVATLLLGGVVWLLVRRRRAPGG